MKNKNKKKASLLVGLKVNDDSKFTNNSNVDKTNLMKEFFKFTTVEPPKGETKRAKEKNIQRPNFNLKGSFKSSSLHRDLQPFTSIESLLKQLIKDAVNNAVTVAVEDANRKKERVISAAEERLNGSIQKIINSDTDFQNKVRDLYLLLSKEDYNISKTSKDLDSSNQIEISSEITDEEKLRDLAIKNNLTGALHLFYPNETATFDDVAGHIDQERLVNNLLEMQSSTTKPKTKKNKKARGKQRNDKR